MNKRRLHHFWRTFRRIKPIYFLIPALLLGIVCLFALRANSMRMSELRDAVYTADRDNGDTQTALNQLQAYVTAHMNTNLNTGNNVYPPIQLQHTYERLVQSQGANLQASNGDLYNQAQEYCQQQNPSDFSGRNRIPCIQRFVQERGVQSAPTATISPNLYQFDFVSPKWSPDLAGWTMLGSVMLFLIAAVKFVTDKYLKRLLK